MTAPDLPKGWFLRDVRRAAARVRQWAEEDKRRMGMADLPKMTPRANERPIGRYNYEDGSYVRIVAGGDIDTEAALEMVETLIDLKRKELARRKPKASGAATIAEESDD